MSAPGCRDVSQEDRWAVATFLNARVGVSRTCVRLETSSDPPDLDGATISGSVLEWRFCDQRVESLDATPGSAVLAAREPVGVAGGPCGTPWRRIDAALTPGAKIKTSDRLDVPGADSPSSDPTRANGCEGTMYVRTIWFSRRVLFNEFRGSSIETTDELNLPDCRARCRSHGLKHHSSSPALDTHEAAALLGVSPATLRDWKCQRIGPPYIQLSPRCVRYAQADLEKFLSDRRVVPTVRVLRSPRHATLRRSNKSV
jgi:predicted DNA-binding transcriptional regulator AlpA